MNSIRDLFKELEMQQYEETLEFITLVRDYFNIDSSVTDEYVISTFELLNQKFNEMRCNR